MLLFNELRVSSERDILFTDRSAAQSAAAPRTAELAGPPQDEAALSLSSVSQ